MQTSKDRLALFRQDLATENISFREVLSHSYHYIAFERTIRILHKNRRRLRKHARHLNHSAAVFALREDLKNL